MNSLIYFEYTLTWKVSTSNKIDNYRFSKEVNFFCVYVFLLCHCVWCTSVEQLIFGMISRPQRVKLVKVCSERQLHSDLSISTKLELVPFSFFTKITFKIVGLLVWRARLPRRIFISGFFQSIEKLQDFQKLKTREIKVLKLIFTTRPGLKDNNGIIWPKTHYPCVKSFSKNFLKFLNICMWWEHANNFCSNFNTCAMFCIFSNFSYR